jgi:predicted component of type VI protein secretion system
VAATITSQDDHFTVKDCGSLTGTTINRLKLTPHTPQRLETGDCIVLGPENAAVAQFRFIFMQHEATSVEHEEQSGSLSPSLLPSSHSPSSPIPLLEDSTVPTEKEKLLRSTPRRKLHASTQTDFMDSGVAFQLKADLTCSICLGFVQKAALLPCGHMFCYQCIRDWIAKVSRKLFLV